LESQKIGAAIAIVAVAAAAVLFVVLSGDDSEESEPPATVTTTTDTGANGASGANGGGGGQGAGAGENRQPPPEPEVPTIVVRGGEPVGGVQDLSFSQGDDIRFKVESDHAGEIHFHGYDVSMDVSAGGSVAFNVPAEIEGVFEVEVEETATQIAEITVNPG
jgi:hypothetical protein